MPASNQLVDWASIRSLIATAVGAGYLQWITSDPGTDTLPDNRVSTVLELLTYLSLNSLGDPDTLCPDYSKIISMVPATSVSVTNLDAVSDENRISFDLVAEGYPTGATIDYNVYINGIFQGGNTGESIGNHIDFGTGGSMSFGDDASVDVFLKYLGNTIATGGDSTTAS